MSAKQVAKQIKSKGLQRLRWYCQLCEKQCRDENGFRCHCSSAAHLRQLAVFAQNQKKVVQDYSEQFRRAFLSVLTLTYQNSRVAANKVYNEVIAHKEHVHMNATRWTSLTEFVKDLASQGVCAVEETDKGLFVSLIQRRDLETAVKRRRSDDFSSDKRQQKIVEQQVKKIALDQSQWCSPTGLKEVGSTFTVNLDMKKKTPIGMHNSRPTSCVQASSSRTEECPLLGCIVRYKYGQHESGNHKFVIVDVKDDFVYLRGLSKADLIKTSVDNISLIIPAIGGRIKIVRGEQKGATGTLVGIDQEGKSVHVRVDDVSLDILRLPYSGVSKYDADYSSRT